MRLGLYAPRRSSFWLVGPLAKAALKRGHDVVLLGDRQPLKPGDAWLIHERERDLPGAGFDMLRDFEGDWIASAPPEQNWVETVALSIKLCSLDPWLDSLALPFADAYDLTHRTIRHGLLPTDGLADCQDRAKTDLVWFLPKTSVEGTLPALQHRLLIAWLARRLARTAKAMNLRFVVKTRSKIRLSGAVRRLADELIEDPSLYPHDSLKALCSAKLAVCHQSAAALEAVAAGVRVISLPVWQPYLHKYAHWPLMSARRGSPYAWPGVIDVRSAWRPLLPHAGKVIDMDQRAAYLDTWLGGRVMGTSDWLLDEMEKRA